MPHATAAASDGLSIELPPCRTKGFGTGRFNRRNAIQIETRLSSSVQVQLPDVDRQSINSRALDELGRLVEGGETQVVRQGGQVAAHTRQRGQLPFDRGPGRVRRLDDVRDAGR